MSTIERSLPLVGFLAGVAALVMLLTGVGRIGGATTSRRIVTVDLVRILNSERKALPQLAKQSGGDPTLAILRIGRAIEPTVKEVAGPGTVVLVKQAVVDANLPDITDAVLGKLGLPLHAPTINLTRGLLPAPTTDASMNSHAWAAISEQQSQQAKHLLKGAKEKELNGKLP
jgi:hypothetical protein